MNSAGAALAKAAAETRAVQPEIASQGVKKGHIRVVDRDRDRFSVDVSTIAMSVLQLRGALPRAFNDLQNVLFLAVSLKAARFQPARLEVRNGSPLLVKASASSTVTAGTSPMVNPAF